MKSQLLFPLLLAIIHCSYATLPLNDAIAITNQIFTYKLDPKDFPDKLPIVTEEGKSVLPSWLSYDAVNHQLSGVPSVKDKGTCILSASGEVFAVTVTDSTKTRVAEPVGKNDELICKPHESITVVYVKVNTDVGQLLPEKRVQLVSDLSKYLNLKSDHVSLAAQPRDLVDSTAALVSGPGDAATSSNDVSVLSWVVGCGAVKSHHMDILESLESSAKDGSIGKLLGIPTSGWQVQSNQAKMITNRRLKRDVRATSTPSPMSPSPGDTTSTRTNAVTPTAVIVQETSSIPPIILPSTADPVKVNRKPEVNEALAPAVLTGYVDQLFKWTLPAGLFTDPEGEELDYTLEDMISGNELMRLEPWFVYKVPNGGYEVAGIPSRQLEFQSKKMALRATDVSGASVVLPLEVNVQPSQAEHVTEAYSISVKSTSSLSGGASSLYLALTLAQYLDFDNFILMDFAISSGMVMAKFGDNRGRVASCPYMQHEKTEKMLRRAVNSPMIMAGRDALGFLEISSLDKISPMDPCEDNSPVRDDTEASKLEAITVTKGQLYEMQLPDHLFIDREDGNMRNLEVQLLADGQDKCMGMLCLDKKTRTIQALTWNDLQTPAQFELIVTDSAGNEVDLPIEATVVHTYEEPSHQFTLTVDGSFSQFTNSLQKQVKMYKSLGNAFSGSAVNLIDVKEGSVKVLFSMQNEETAASGSECPTNAIQSFKQQVFKDGKLSPTFTEALKDYKILQVEFTPLGLCKDEFEAETVNNRVTGETGSGEKSSFPIVVVIVIVVVVIIIVIIIVIVVIKRRKAKRDASTSSNIEKGVPVVMDKEMEAIEQPEQRPLIKDSGQVSYKPTKPPAYPNEHKRSDGYQPPTPPVSEPDDHQDLDRSL